MASTLPHLMTAEEAAARLNVSLPRFYELARTGMVPVVRLGRQVRISAEALELWIARGGEPLGRG